MPRPVGTSRCRASRRTPGTASACSGSPVSGHEVRNRRLPEGTESIGIAMICMIITATGRSESRKVRTDHGGVAIVREQGFEVRDDHRIVAHIDHSDTRGDAPSRLVRVLPGGQAALDVDDPVDPRFANEVHHAPDERAPVQPGAFPRLRDVARKTSAARRSASKFVVPPKSAS